MVDVGAMRRPEEVTYGEEEKGGGKKMRKKLVSKYLLKDRFICWSWFE